MIREGLSKEKGESSLAKGPVSAEGLGLSGAGVGGTAGGCLDGQVPRSRLGRWVATVLLFYIVLTPIVLSRGRKTLGKHLYISASTVCCIVSIFKLCFVLNHCFQKLFISQKVH